MESNSNKWLYVLVGVVGAFVFWWVVARWHRQHAQPLPAPNAPLIQPVFPVQPCPPNRPCPRWEREPVAPVGAYLTIAQQPAPGDEPIIDLLAMPREFRRPNVSSKGAGCCTFRSAEYAARWQNEPVLFGLPEWMIQEGIAGGGTPTKQAQIIARIAAARKMPTPRFVQYEGRDPALIELALKTGRLPCVTWRAAHMLTCVHLDSERAAVLDNNSPDRVQWMSRSEFLASWTAGGGGWTFVLLSPGPPPAPRSRGAREGQGWRASGFASRLAKESLAVASQASAAPPASSCKCQPHRKRCACPSDCARCRQSWDITMPRCPGGCHCTPPEGNGMEWHFEGDESYSFNGWMSDLHEVASALEDDARKPHLTIIGTVAEQQAALAGIPNQILDYLRVQRYAADAWELNCGFVVAGKPTVYLQATDGTVLLRRNGEAAKNGLASAVIEALRRADPNYRPDSDPGGATPLMPFELDSKTIQLYGPWVLAGVAGLVALHLASAKKRARPVRKPALPPQTDLAARLAAIESRLNRPAE